MIKQSGADILRMWVCASDYADDLRIGPEILKTTVETYRKLRNTLRWMLGSLAHWHVEERGRGRQMPELERLMLHRLSRARRLVRQAYAEFDYKRIFAALNAFMTNDLSAFYFDIRKDALYCDPISSPTRRACLTVLDHLFRCTVTWLAPMLPFTAEEAWLARSAAISLDHSFGSQASAEQHAFRVGASRIISRCARFLARRRTGGEMAQGAACAPCRDRRNRDRTGAQAHRLLAGGRSARATCTTPTCLPRSSMSISRRLRSRRRRLLVEGDGPPNAFRLDDVAGVAVEVQCWREERNAPVPGKSSERRLRPAYPDVSPRDAQALREWETMRRAAE